MASKLTLRTERLAELTTDDLHSVAGAAAEAASAKLCLTIINCPTIQCTTAMSCGCQPTWNCA